MSSRTYLAPGKSDSDWWIRMNLCNDSIYLNLDWEDLRVSKNSWLSKDSWISHMIHKYPEIHESQGIHKSPKIYRAWASFYSSSWHNNLRGHVSLDRLPRFLGKFYDPGLFVLLRENDPCVEHCIMESCKFNIYESISTKVLWNPTLFWT